MSRPITCARLAADTIIVGLDGSANSLHALSWAIDSAAAHASITAVSSWSQPVAGQLPLVGFPIPPFDLLEADATTKLDNLVASAESETGTRPGRIERRTVMGSARYVLTEASEEADLVVVGRTGRGRVERMLVGSTASAVARHASCPVAIIPEGLPTMRRFVVALDGSPNAARALRWAVMQPGSEVTAVFSHDEWILDDLGFDDETRRELGERAEAQLADAVEAALVETAVHPNEVTLEVRHGDPRATIVDQGASDEVLVLGARGVGGVAGTMVGSLADHAIRHGRGGVIIHH